MAEDLAFSLDVRLEGAQTVEELKAVLKAARNEAVRFGEGTAEFDKFTKVAGKAKDQIGDLNDRIKALDPGSKVQAFAGLAQTIAGGFAAAQGAAALFGSENEDLQKAILKTQGAVALLQGIQAIADSKKQLGAVAAILGLRGQEAATRGVTLATITLSGALKAAGIGLAIAAIVALISNIEKVTGWIKRLWDSEGARIDETIAKFTKMQAARELAFGVDAASIRLMKARGAAAENVYAAELKLLMLQRAAAKEEKDLLSQKQAKGKLDKEEAERLRELVLAVSGYNAEIAETTAAEKKRIDDVAKVWAEGEAARKLARERAAREEGVLMGETRDVEIQQTKKLVAVKIDGSALVNAVTTNYREQELANIKATEEAKYSLASSGVEGLLQLSNILMKEGKKAEGVRKGLALAQIGIDTAQAIGALVAYSNTAATASGPAAPFVAAAYYATGIVRILAGIAKAKQLLGKSGGGSDISPPSMGGGGGGGGRDVSRPPDIFAGSQRTLLDDAERRRGKQSAPVIIEAVVVETDMTDSQKGVAVANSRARRRVR